MTTWLDGGLVDDAAALVSAFDHGLTVGDGVFETLKVVDGTPFALSRHLRRLLRSAAGLGLPRPDLDAVREGCAAVVAAAGPGLHRLRITCTAGFGPLGSKRGTAAPTLVVAVAPLAPWPASAALHVVPWPRNERGATAGLKTTSYAENVVALAEAHRHGAAEALFADTQGRLSEGTGSNVFVVLDGRLVTPTTDTGCLAGITRELVLEWTDAVAADLPLDALGDADEVFITSSTRDVQPVHAVDGRRLPGVDGGLTAVVVRAFAERSTADRDP